MKDSVFRDNRTPEIPSTFVWVQRGAQGFAIRKGFQEVLFEMGLSHGEDNMAARCGDQVRRFSGRGNVLCLPLPGKGAGYVVLRRYHRGGLLRFFRPDLYFGKKRLLGELRITEAAAQAGIRAPEILALVTERVLPFHYRGLLLSREIEGSLDFREIFHSNSHPLPDSSSFRDIIGRAAREVRKMHDAGFYHRDLNLKNILLERGGCVFLIDFDGARRYNPLPMRLRLKNLFRLSRSAEKGKREGVRIHATDQLRFLREYAQGDGTILRALRSRLRRFRFFLFLHRLLWGFSRPGR